VDEGGRDFFISYRSADRAWAEWIAWELEATGYTVFVQAWDFRPGQNFVHQMQQGASACARTVAVLTPAYFESGFTQSEWYSAFAKDPTGKAGLLLPVRVRECDVEGLLGPIIYIDLMGLDETQARERLLAGINGTRAKPTRAPTFPGLAAPVKRAKPAFPTTPPSVANGSPSVVTAGDTSGQPTRARGGGQMDPVTTAILSALAAGASKEVVADGYRALKNLLGRKFGGGSDVVTAVEELEKKPDSAGRKEMLKEEIAAARADQDPDVLRAAQALIEKIGALPGGGQVIKQTVTGNQNVFSGSGNVAVTFGAGKES
jgi:TIR domain/Het-E N-terminal domain